MEFDNDNVFYVDRFNKIINVLVDDTGVVYVPLDRVTGVRRVVRKNITCPDDFSTNPENYDLLDTSADEEALDRRDKNTRVVMHRSQPNLATNQRIKNQSINLDTNQRIKNQSINLDTSQYKNRNANKENTKPVFHRDDNSNRFNNGVEENFTTSSPKQKVSTDFLPVIKPVELPLNEFVNVVVADLPKPEGKDAWVQLDDNLITIATMTQKATDAVENSTSFKPSVGQLCLANFDGCWFRALVLAVRPKLHVRYIDYGNEQNGVEGDVFPLPLELNQIPAQAVRILLEDGAPKCLKIDELVKVKPVRFTNDVYHVHVEGGMYSKKNTLNSSKLPTVNGQTVKESEPTALPEKKPEPTALPEKKPEPSALPEKKPEPSALPEKEPEPSALPEKEPEPTVLNLSNGEKVQLVCESNGFLFVRNRKGDQLLQRVTLLLQEEIETASVISSKPKTAQLVAAFFEDGWYRAVVNTVEGDLANILYVDYGNEEIQPWKKFKMLPRELKQIPYTLFKIKLQGCENKDFTPQTLEYLTELSEKKVLLAATFEETVDNGVVLTTKNGENIVEQIKLKNINKRPQPFKAVNSLKSSTNSISSKKQYRVPNKDDPRFKITDLPISQIKLGQQKLHVLSQANGLLGFCLDDEQLIQRIQVELTNEINAYVQQYAPHDSYTPEYLDVMLVKHAGSGQWRRAVCLEVAESEEFPVYFIDHGQLDTVKKEDVRRISPDFINFQPIACFGSLTDLPAVISERAQERLNQLLPVGCKLSAEVVSRDEDEELYTINAVSILETLKKENLI